MIKLVKRTTLRAASPATLARRVVYISDAKHRDHRGKTIHPARNYNCPNQSPETFRKAVLEAEDAYKRARLGKRGKRSPRLFEEIIYSSPHGADLTWLEREQIETMVINLIGRHAACRTAWHVDDKTGRVDFHVLMAAKTQDHPPRVTLWAQFGGSERRHIYAEFDRLDELITSQLNRSPERHTPLKSASRIHRETVREIIGSKPSLAAEIAAKCAYKITADNIAAAVTSLGHSVTKLTSRTISVVFRGRVKPRRYNLDDLLLHIAANQPDSLDGPEMS